MRANIEAVNPPVMNAACSEAKTPEDVEALCATKIGAVVGGSITVESRDGNPEPRWHEGDDYGLNSFGMPNGGREYYQKHLPGMVARAHESGKLFVANLAGFNQDEYVELARMADEAEVDILELNFGCPNISEDGKQKPIVSFDIETMQNIVAAVYETTSIPLNVKLSPYSNPDELKRVADMIAESNQAAGVVTANTFPNGFMMENGQPVLAAGLGGVSGRAMLPIGLGQVRQFRQRLPEDIAVIGVGGIESKKDADLYFQAGAAAVQAATLIVREGHQAIDRIVEEPGD